MSMVAVLTSALLIGGASEDAQAFADNAQTRLMEGRNLQEGWRQEFDLMEPADRFALIIWLRRSGMYVGEAIPLNDMLRPLVTNEAEK